MEMAHRNSLTTAVTGMWDKVKRVRDAMTSLLIKSAARRKHPSAQKWRDTGTW
jgi:hypothetical protein